MMTFRARRVLDPKSEETKLEQEHQRRERRLQRQREQYSRLLDNEDFRSFMFDQAMLNRYGKTPAMEENEFTRGQRAAFAALMQRVVGLAGEKGEDFMVQWARRFARQCREFYNENKE